jgi:hypothetical protein
MEKCKFSSGLPSSKSSGTSTQGATTWDAHNKH